MRMYDIIEKKRDKKELTKEEIDFFIKAYCDDEIPEYQVSALLMAIYLNGMNYDELTYLTSAMTNSSNKLDLSSIKEHGVSIVDKHSTGGVGDKVAMLVLPIVASLGIDVFKMYERKLGYSLGTIDKFESIQGYNMNISIDNALDQVEDIGICIMAQNLDIAVADKKLYELRDITATVDSIDLMAASIMSRELAFGTDKILLNVTVGSGAFMKNIEDARNLAKSIVKIGKKSGVETKVIITSMHEPLGKNVGSTVEVKEVISFLLSDKETLFNTVPKDLREIVFELSAWMIKMAGYGDNINKNKESVLEAITSKAAYNKFIELIEYQGGRVQNVYMDWISQDLDMPVLKDNAKYLKEIRSQEDGYVVSIDSKLIGEALVCLGGGKLTEADKIDHSVGFEFNKKVGDRVHDGDTILTVLYSDKKKFEEAFDYIESAIYIENLEEGLVRKLRSVPHVIEIIE